MKSRSFRVLPAIALWAAVLVLGGCGGGGGGGGGGGTPPPAANTQPIVVEPGPAYVANLLFTSVTICAPGSARCQTIDHVLVDTGSSGLRMMSSAVNAAALALPTQTNGAGQPVVECMQFINSYSWGPVKVADVRMAGLSASSVAVQVIGDAAFPIVPSECANTGASANTVEELGANGILGIGVFLQDCGPACAVIASNDLYYACPAAAACQPTTLPVTKQVANPVALFASDNNGVIIDLPAVPPSGAATVTGQLVFGIGTQGDNAPGNVTVLPVDVQTGNVVTVYDGRTYRESFFDTGSSVLFFGTNAYPICSGFAAGLYCPATTQTLSAVVRGTNGASRTNTFSVANADALLAANPTSAAFNNLAAPYPDASGFDWGLPFYFGRRVYTAFEGRWTPAGVGPYVAY